MMDLDQFRASLALAAPPPELDSALAGLWWDLRGDWRRAHEAAQQDEGARGAWVHEPAARGCPARRSTLLAG